MYMYMCMPAIAKLQWHPISLAGSPSADSLAVLVRNSGELAHGLLCTLCRPAQRCCFMLSVGILLPSSTGSDLTACSTD